MQYSYVILCNSNLKSEVSRGSGVFFHQLVVSERFKFPDFMDLCVDIILLLDCSVMTGGCGVRTRRKESKKVKKDTSKEEEMEK